MSASFQRWSGAVATSSSTRRARAAGGAAREARTAVPVAPLAVADREAGCSRLEGATTGTLALAPAGPPRARTGPGCAWRAPRAGPGPAGLWIPEGTYSCDSRLASSLARSSTGPLVLAAYDGSQSYDAGSVGVTRTNALPSSFSSKPQSLGRFSPGLA